MRKNGLAWAVGLVLLVEVALFSASFNKFFCGDSLYFFSHATHSAGEVARVFTTLDDLSTYRPLPTVLFSFVLEPLFGFHPLPYHVVALGVHLLTSLLVFFLLRRVTRSDTAALVGLIFFGTQATGFYLTYDATFLPDFTTGLLTAAAFLWFAYGRRWLSLLPFALALFCKESAVMIPAGLAVIAMLEATDEHRSEIGALRDVVPHATLAGLFLIFQYYLHDGWLYPSGKSAYHIAFGPSSLFLKTKYLPWLLNLPADWVRQRSGMIPSILLMIPPLIWMTRRVWRCRNREAMTLLLCAGWAVAALLPALPVAQVPMKHNLYIPLIAAAVAIARCVSHAPLRRTAWWLAACFMAATAFHVRNDLTLSWVAEGSDVTEASLQAVQRAYPVLSRGAQFFILPASVPGGIAWYFDDEALFRRAYDEPRLRVYYADLQRLPPAGFERGARVLVFAFYGGRLYDVTADYKRAVVSTETHSSSSSSENLLPGPAGPPSDAFSRARIVSELDWPADQRIDGQAAKAMPQAAGDSLRESLVILPQTVVRIPVDALPPDSQLLAGVQRAGQQRGAAQGRLSWESGGRSQVLARVLIDSPKSDSEPWQDGAVDLSRFAGQSGTLAIENTGGRNSDWITWNRLRIVPKASREPAVERGSLPLPTGADPLLMDFSKASISSEIPWSAADMPGGRAATLQLLNRGGESHEAMLVLPGASVRFVVRIPENGRLRFALSSGPSRGCGGQPIVAFESGGQSSLLFRLVLDDDVDADTWWQEELDLSRFHGQQGVLLFRNEASRTCQMAAWSDVELTSADAPPAAGRPLADRGLSLLDRLDTARRDFDRGETYPNYEKFDTPTGQPAFLWCDTLARPARLSVVTIAGARLRFDLASLPEHSYLSLGVAQGTGVGDGVDAHVYWEDAQGREEIYQRLVTPQMRDWEDAIVALPRRAAAGGTLSIEASSGPKHNSVGDWLAWSRLRIVSGR